MVIFVAANTRESIEQAARDFREATGTAVEVSLGPSTRLANQIE